MAASIAALGGSACNSRSAANNKVDELADRACACTDAACAERVVDDLVVYANTNPRISGDEDAAHKSGQRLGACVVKAGVDSAKFVQRMSSLGNSR